MANLQRDVTRECCNYKANGASQLSPWELLDLRAKWISSNNIVDLQMWVMTLVGVKLFLRAEELVSMQFASQDGVGAINWIVSCIEGMTRWNPLHLIFKVNATKKLWLWCSGPTTRSRPYPFISPVRTLEHDSGGYLTPERIQDGPQEERSGYHPSSHPFTPMPPLRSARLAGNGLHASPDSPLFQINGRPLVTKEFNEFITESLIFAGFDIARFKGHSWRIGGASALAAAGVPDSAIQILGRWKSSTFIRYISVTPDTIAKAHLILSTSPDLLSFGSITQNHFFDGNPHARP